jgi:hypothetical protein
VHPEGELELAGGIDVNGDQESLLGAVEIMPCDFQAGRADRSPQRIGDG